MNSDPIREAVNLACRSYSNNSLVDVALALDGGHGVIETIPGYAQVAASTTASDLTAIFMSIVLTRIRTDSKNLIRFLGGVFWPVVSTGDITRLSEPLGKFRTWLGDDTTLMDTLTETLTKLHSQTAPTRNLTTFSRMDDDEVRQDSVEFAEYLPEHADRLRTSQNFVRIRRRVLEGLLTGSSLTKSRQNNDIPDRVCSMTVEDLCASLQVRPVHVGNQIVLEPDPNQPITADLGVGMWLDTRRAVTGIQIGGEGRARTVLIPPYGYSKIADGQWVLDAPACNAVGDAFYLILDPTFRSQRAGQSVVAWGQIAQALNEEGYSRKDGEDWRGDDVRSLLRAPTYAGYAFHEQSGKLYRAPFIEEPIVELNVFLEAIRISGATQRRDIGKWFSRLEQIAQEQIAPWDLELPPELLDNGSDAEIGSE